MVKDNYWHIFGPAAICSALGRLPPRVIDVYFKSFPPERREIAAFLELGDSSQIRFTKQEPTPIVDVDCIQLRPKGYGLEVVGQSSALFRKKVAVLTHNICVTDSLRLNRMMILFSDFEWPTYLQKKVHNDVIYAEIAATYDEALRLVAMNLEHDFHVPF